MLTGRRRLRADNLGELLRQVQEQEPERPRVLQSEEDRDLETIALKCLEKDPRKRYGSAEEVAEELGRWLGETHFCAAGGSSDVVGGGVSGTRRSPG